MFIGHKIATTAQRRLARPQLRWAARSTGLQPLVAPCDRIIRHGTGDELVRSTVGAKGRWRRRMNVLGKLWRGQYSLPRTFWGFYILGQIACFALLAIILIISYRSHLGTLGFIFGFLIISCYWIIAAVGVWRSASTYLASPIWMTRAWAVAARGVVVLFAARVVWGLANGGAQALERMTARMDF